MTSATNPPPNDRRNQQNFQGYQGGTNWNQNSNSNRGNFRGGKNRGGGNSNRGGARSFNDPNRNFNTSANTSQNEERFVESREVIQLLTWFLECTKIILI